MNMDRNNFVTKASLDRPVINPFINDIKIKALKNSRIIKQVKLELTFDSSIIDISIIGST